MAQSKTIGMIGGIGPESTIDYYRLLLDGYRRRVPGGSAPSIIINSIDVNKALAMLDAGDLQKLIDYLVPEIERLARAGADFAFLSANTPHIVFNELQRRSTIPLVSIVEAACAAAMARGLKKLALLGTRFTMQGRFYPEVFSRSGIMLVVPSPEEQEAIHKKYMNEFLKGIFRQEARELVVGAIERLKAQEQIEGAVLAGTELPLLLRDAGDVGIPFLDTTKIHVDTLIERMLDKSKE